MGMSRRLLLATALCTAVACWWRAPAAELESPWLDRLTALKCKLRESRR
jgi:hypothetical protein